MGRSLCSELNDGHSVLRLAFARLTSTLRSLLESAVRAGEVAAVRLAEPSARAGRSLSVSARGQFAQRPPRTGRGWGGRRRSLGGASSRTGRRAGAGPRESSRACGLSSLRLEPRLRHRGFPSLRLAWVPGGRGGRVRSGGGVSGEGRARAGPPESLSRCPQTG